MVQISEVIERAHQASEASGKEQDYWEVVRAYTQAEEVCAAKGCTCAPWEKALELLKLRNEVIR